MQTCSLFLGMFNFFGSVAAESGCFLFAYCMPFLCLCHNLSSQSRNTTRFGCLLAHQTAKVKAIRTLFSPSGKVFVSNDNENINLTWLCAISLS